MSGYYNQVKKFIELKYPEFEGYISGGYYPPPFYIQFLANLMTYVWYIGIILLLFTDPIFNFIHDLLFSKNQAEKDKKLNNSLITEETFNQIRNYVADNKGQLFFGLIMCNFFIMSFYSTGAFEIYADGELVYSKIKTGRLPSTNDIRSLLNVLGFDALE